jgi:polyisoprenoid-binding protein YceI
MNCIKKIAPFTVVLAMLQLFSFGQRVFTKNGHISFFSKTNMENISADNNQVMSVLNIQSGELLFTVLMKGFHFEKALMEEHFHENYVESEKFPKASFKGAVAEISKVNFGVDGSYNITVAGDLTIHGVTQKVSTNGKIVISGGKITASSKFIIKLADYKVLIPKLVKENISETLEISVQCLYDQKM